jgi:predicted nucleic acid-binding protein
MMLVVADTSPLIALVNIGHVDVLPQLFTEVVIPPEVAGELREEKRPSNVREFFGVPPKWLLTRAALRSDAIPLLHIGEQAAINLALELNADLLLIDEIQGRKAAAERGIPVTGVIGILEQAARRGMLDLSDAFDRVKASDFWISPGLLDKRLRMFLDSREKP